MPLAQRLKVLREQRGLSFRELGKLANVDHVTIWMVEHGQRPLSMDRAQRLARALGVSLDDLADMDEED